MQNMKENNKIDAIAEPRDTIEIRIQKSIVQGSKTLYINVNGETILRIGWITEDIIIEDET